MTIPDHDQPEQWRLNEVAEYFKLLPPPIAPRSVLDIGANVGLFTQEARRRWPNAQFYACEPHPANCAEFRRRCPWATLYSVAVGDCSGVGKLREGDQDVVHSLKRTKRSTGRIIPCELMDANLLPSCSLVKIDAEGAEVEILQRLDHSMTIHLIYEYHSNACRKLSMQALKGFFTLEGEIEHDGADRMGLMYWRGGA